MKRYYLRRGREWICAPVDHDQMAPFAAGLTIDSDPDRVWLTPSLDLAHERQTLLRHMWGLSTEIRAIAA
jgi:hypothetical protein